MKRLLRLAVGVVAVLVVLAVLPFAASESGEVVTLTTVDDDNVFHDTRVWVVDMDDASYLRAGSADAVWLARVQAEPRVLIERGGEPRRARLEVAAERTAEVNALMARKYGWADMVVGTFFPRDDAVAVRVAPQ